MCHVLPLYEKMVSDFDIEVRRACAHVFHEVSHFSDSQIASLWNDSQAVKPLYNMFFILLAD